jgi:hypothetical protein
MFCVEMNREMKLLDYFFTRRAFGFWSELDPEIGNFYFILLSLLL